MQQLALEPSSHPEYDMPFRVPRIAPSEITPESVYLTRRTLLQGALVTGASALLPAAHAEQPAGTWAPGPAGSTEQIERNQQTEKPHPRGTQSVGGA